MTHRKIVAALATERNIITHVMFSGSRKLTSRFTPEELVMQAGFVRVFREWRHEEVMEYLRLNQL